MEENKKPKQTLRILDYIAKLGSITSREAMNDLGIWRLASRISDLKRLGYVIDSEFVTVYNRFNEPCKIKKYFIKKDEKNNEKK